MAEDTFERHVHLPNVISDNFGISTSSARSMMLSGRVKIDGQELPHNVYNVPVSQIDGKTVVVEGDVRSLRFVYKAEA